jgi:hypothetical protein
LFNSRGVGATWELPYLWNGSIGSERARLLRHVRTQEVDQVKPAPRGRWSGVAIRLGYLALNFIILCVYYEHLDLAGWVRLQPFDTIREKESVVRRAVAQYVGMGEVVPITQRELIVRTWAVLDVIVPDYLILSMYHDLFAIMFIAAGLDESWEWPPLFGPITEAYSMRRYWSIFWHRLIYKTFNAHAATILSLFGQDRRSVGSRLSQNFLVFAFSAAMHAAVSWRLGNRCAGGDLRWWLLQPLAFVLEGLVASLWKKLRSDVLVKVHPSALIAFERVVGHMWVFAWLFWSAPKGRLPMLFCGRK